MKKYYPFFSTLNIEYAQRRLIETIEQFRADEGLTQKEMAKKLDIGYSTYRKLLDGEISSVNLRIIYKFHLLTGMWLYQMIGESSPYSAELDKYMELPPDQQKVVRDLVDALFQLNKKDR